ncbi:glycosyltransferase [bacterium]|nr:glycosyltransferase [bacterium]
MTQTDQNKNNPLEDSESYQILESRDGNRVLRVKTIDGWRYLDSLTNPQAEANVLVPEVIPTALLILGTGSGYILNEIRSKNLQRVLAVTTHPIAFREAECRFEELEASKLTLSCSTNPDRFFKSEVLPLLQQYPDFLIVKHPREWQAFPNFFNRIELLLYLVKKKKDQKFRKELKRVLMVNNGNLFESELEQEFLRRGYEVLHMPARFGTKYLMDQSIQILEESKPSFVFSTNNLASDKTCIFPQICEKYGVSWGTWLLDDPRYILSTIEQQEPQRGRTAFCWDRNGVESWQEMGLGKAYPLPLCTDPNIFFPQDGIAELKDRVVFVGSPRFASSKGFFAALETKDSAYTIAEHIKTEILETRKTPSLARIEKFIEQENFGDFRGEMLRRLPAFITQIVNEHYRLNLLLELEEYNPIVFGNGWDKLLPSSFDIRPSVDYYNNLPNIYASDAIHLSFTNMQMRAYPNQRVFDIGASGRFVLNDYLEGWEELFGNELNDLVYKTTDELKSKITFYLNHPEKRHELSNLLRQEVLEHHTIRHRVDRILEVLKV